MLTTAELEAMRATQATTMMDACKLLTPSDVEGNFGQEDTTYTAGSEIPCGFEPGSAARGGSVAGLVVDLAVRFRLRLEDGASVTSGHRIELTKRMGVAISPTQVYQVMGYPKLGITCYVVEAKRVR